MSKRWKGNAWTSKCLDFQRHQDGSFCVSGGTRHFRKHQPPEREYEKSCTVLRKGPMFGKFTSVISHALNHTSKMRTMLEIEARHIGHTAPLEVCIRKTHVSQKHRWPHGTGAWVAAWSMQTTQAGGSGCGGGGKGRSRGAEVGVVACTAGSRNIEPMSDTRCDTCEEGPAMRSGEGRPPRPRAVARPRVG
jgi:hypothetical protein